MLQYNKDSGDILLILRHARGLNAFKSQNTYNIDKLDLLKYFALVHLYLAKYKNRKPTTISIVYTTKYLNCFGPRTSQQKYRTSILKILEDLQSIIEKTRMSCYNRRKNLQDGKNSTTSSQKARGLQQYRGLLQYTTNFFGNKKEIKKV